jgi:hypothetical protein
MKINDSTKDVDDEEKEKYGYTYHGNLTPFPLSGLLFKALAGNLEIASSVLDSATVRLHLVQLRLVVKNPSNIVPHSPSDLV